MTNVTPIEKLNAKDRAFFKQMHDRFTTRLSDTIAEVRSEDPDNQDWSRIEHQFLVYGFFLEQEPGGCLYITEQNKKG